MTLDDPVPYRDGCRLVMAGLAELADVLIDRRPDLIGDVRGPVELVYRPAHHVLALLRRDAARACHELVRVRCNPDELETFGAAVRRERP